MNELNTPFEMQNETTAPTLHCGMIAVVGRTNVGKSTLVNTILEEKISIVSNVVQTTRNTIRGIFTDPRGQLVFLDTPGVHKAQNELGKLMNKQARASIDGVDTVLLVLDGSRVPQEEDEGWMRRLAHEPAALFILLNKADKEIDRSEEYRALWENIQREKSTDKPAHWIRLSALQRDGIDGLVQQLFDTMPLSPLLFPEDILTDFPRKLNIADIIREQLFDKLYHELPHAIGVITEDVLETEKGWNVKALIYVDRHSQKPIILGKKGRLVRAVTRRAEKILSDMYQTRVTVKLWVKVEPGWSKNFWLLKNMGYIQ
jgi:GTP-binding protein Era